MINWDESKARHSTEWSINRERGGGSAGKHEVQQATYSQRAFPSTGQHLRSTPEHLEWRCGDAQLMPTAMQAFLSDSATDSFSERACELRTLRRVARHGRIKPGQRHAYPALEQLGRSADVERTWNQAFEIANSLAER